MYRLLRLDLATAPAAVRRVGSEGRLSVDATKFGTIDPPDGGTQVTYAGMPLYLFTGDTAGQATGQGFEDFFAVTASGGITSGTAVASGMAGGDSHY